MSSKKRKITEDKDASSEEGRCTFYNEKKKRKCRQLLSPKVPEPFASEPNFKPLFCGNHGNVYATLFKDRKQQQQKVIHNNESESRGKRIPCPIDPSHMIFENNLKIHIRKCPKAMNEIKERQRVYYKHDINTGGCGKYQFRDAKGEVDAQNLVRRILRAYRNTFMKSSRSSDPIDITSLTLEEMYDAIPLENKFTTAEEEGLISMIATHRVKIGGKKHMQQIGSLVGHIRRHDNLLESDTVLEMGAGRATTGFAVAGFCAAKKQKQDKVKLVVVERGGARSKADSAARRIKNNNKNNNNTTGENDPPSTTITTAGGDIEYFRGDGVDFHRIKCDLAHVSIPHAMAEVEGEAVLLCQEVNVNTVDVDNTSNSNATTGHKDGKRNVLVIAKHLCGAGTDLALKSIVPIRHRINGYILATCCHGVCSWDLYVGRDFLGNAMCSDSEKGESFGEAEFKYFRRWATGTVVGHRQLYKGSDNDNDKKVKESDADADIEHPNNDEGNDDEYIIGVSQIASLMNLKCGAEGLGRACQRLIDYGRCEYMRKELLGNDDKVSLPHYVDKNITPQNAMLFGIAEECKE